MTNFQTGDAACKADLFCIIIMPAVLYFKKPVERESVNALSNVFPAKYVREKTA